MGDVSNYGSGLPMSRAPRQLLTSSVAHSRPVGCPQMTWGRALENAALASVPFGFVLVRVRVRMRSPVKAFPRNLRSGLPLRRIGRSGDSRLTPNQNLLMPDG